MKKIFAGCAVIVAVVVAVFVIGFAAIFNLSSEAVDTADAFFKEVAAGDFENARNYLSKEFKASTTAPELEAFLSKSSLLDYKEANWRGRSFEVNAETKSRTLVGEFVTTSGDSIPITMDFVEESDGWKIVDIQRQE